jgi:predicted amidohydrolase YtcJ
MANTLGTTEDGAVAYVNGHVYTMDDKQPWVEAFIVSNGKFTAVGSTRDIQTQANAQNLQIVDLEQQFVMPGIHDAHMHLMYAGLALLSNVELDIDTTTANLAERIKSGMCTCEHPDVYGGWNRANTFAVSDFDRSCLDEEFPDTPVYIIGGGGHSMYANTALLREAGYDLQNEPDSQGAVYIRRPDGSLTGEMRELAMTKAALALPKPELSHIKKAIQTGLKQAHSAGITSLQEASGNTVLLQALAELDRDGVLQADVYAHIIDAPEQLAGERRKDLQALLDVSDTFESEHVHTNYVKFLLDGVPLPPLFSQCGLDDQGQADQSKITVPDLEERILYHDAAGKTIKVHATGHGSVRIALDAIAKARQRNPGGPRHEIAHCNSIHPDDYPRFKELHVTAEMSPVFFFNHPAAASAPELFDWNFPELQKSGAQVTVGTDWVGSYDVSLFEYIAGTVERIGDGSKERGGERLCRMLTLGGAEAVGKAGEVGSVTVGRKANFIAVNKDITKGDLGGTKVLQTWFEGHSVWSADRA